jgi:hypothetical protein
MTIISCYRVFPCPPPVNIGSAYFQQSCIMESEYASIGIPIDPHRQTTHDLQIFMNSYQKEGYLIILCMDGTQDDEHVFQEQDFNAKICTRLRFHYYTNIDRSIATLVESYNLVNVHKLKHQDVPAAHHTGSTQIDIVFISLTATEFIFRCGILNFNSILSSDHHPLHIDLHILRLLGYAVQCTINALAHDLQLNGPRLVEVCHASLIQQLLNHNVAARIDWLYIIELSAWLPQHEFTFNQIDHDVERSMRCAANNCNRNHIKRTNGPTNIPKEYI